jgi:hypothetical protein
LKEADDDLSLGHLGLTVKAYCQIANDYINNNTQKDRDTSDCISHKSLEEKPAEENLTTVFDTASIDAANRSMTHITSKTPATTTEIPPTSNTVITASPDVTTASIMNTTHNNTLSAAAEAKTKRMEMRKNLPRFGHIEVSSVAFIVYVLLDVFYVGHLDKSSLYETLFHCNLLSKHHHHQVGDVTNIYDFPDTYIPINLDPCVNTSTIPDVDVCTNEEYSPIQAAEKIFFGYYKVDYCRSVHAYRGGKNDIPDDMFNNLIGPAYFSSRLENPLKIIQSIFEENEIWDEYLEKKNVFLESEIFTEFYFRRVMGMFMSNTLTIRIEGGNMDGMANNGCGLFKIYSNLNHSCCCNTVNQGGNIAEVSLYATENILEGTEITTSYLRQHVLENCNRKIRNKGLLQYMFICDCFKCVEELKENKKIKELKRIDMVDEVDSNSDDDDY